MSSNLNAVSLHPTRVPPCLAFLRTYALTTIDQNASKEECQERYPVLFDGVWCVRHRPYHLRQHAVWKAGAAKQRLGRSRERAHRRGCQDQANHCRLVLHEVPVCDGERLMMYQSSSLMRRALVYR